jgi:purine nucleosidase
MNPLTTTSPATFVLDTDIGTDVDDLLALALILGSPELELEAVCTVYGDVALRARIAARAFAVAGRAAPSIAPGLAETRSGREVWWPGHEGSTIADLDEQAFQTTRDAVAELAAATHVAAIAPLTNVAAAVERPGHAIREIVMMGGAFGDERIEHNIRCDVAAAHTVFESGTSVTVVGLEQTERIGLDRQDVGRIAAAGPLGRLIEAEVLRFWDFTGKSTNVPHDPLALLLLTTPDLFQTARGAITVDADGRTGFSAFAGGAHRIVTDYDVDEAKRQIVDRIVTACTTIPTPLNEEETP